MVGGIKLLFMLKMEATASTPPAAPSRCPVIDFVELIMQFEEEFGIEIPDEDAEGLLSVGEAVDYISQKLN